MKRSKILKKLVLPALLLTASVGLVGCGGDNHSHNFNETWSFDQTHHWHECSSMCGEVNDKEEHFASNWENDNWFHWKTCETCGSNFINTEHIDNNTDGRCDDCNYDITVDAYIYQTQELLNKTYDGLPVSTEGIVASSGAQLSFTWYKHIIDNEFEPMPGNQPPVDAGSYKVVVEAPAFQNYSAATQTFGCFISQATGTLTINRNFNKVYDGQEVEAPTSSDYTTNSDGVVSYQWYKGGTNELLETAPINAGDYRVKITVAYNNNYSQISSSKAFTISKRQLAATNINLDKDYDATLTSVGTATPVGVVSGEDVTITPTAMFTNKNVGSSKSVTISFAMTGNDIRNYIVPENTTGTATIRKATGVINLVNGYTLTRDYNGQAVTEPVRDTDFTTNGEGNITYTWKSSTDGETYADIEGNIAPINSGTYQVVISIEGNSNVSTVSKILNFTIDKVQLTVEGTTIAQDAKYSATKTIDVINNGTLVGVVAGEDVSLTSVVATYQSKGICVDVNVEFSISGQDIGNYLVPVDITKTATIYEYDVNISNDGNGCNAGVQNSVVAGQSYIYKISNYNKNDMSSIEACLYENASSDNDRNKFTKIDCYALDGTLLRGGYDIDNEGFDSASYVYGANGADFYVVAIYKTDGKVCFGWS